MFPTVKSSHWRRPCCCNWSISFLFQSLNDLHPPKLHHDMRGFIVPKEKTQLVHERQDFQRPSSQEKQQNKSHHKRPERHKPCCVHMNNDSFGQRQCDVVIKPSPQREDGRVVGWLSKMSGFNTVDCSLFPASYWKVNIGFTPQNQVVISLITMTNVLLL